MQLKLPLKFYDPNTFTIVMYDAFKVFHKLYGTMKAIKSRHRSMNINKIYQYGRLAVLLNIRKYKPDILYDQISKY